MGKWGRDIGMRGGEMTWGIAEGIVGGEVLGREVLRGGGVASRVNCLPSLSEIRLFLSIFSSNSFFPRTLILLTHVLTLAMISPHVLSPLFHLAFTIHTKSEPLRTQRSRFEDLWNRSYLLARLFARHLLPSDPVSQGFADQQP